MDEDEDEEELDEDSAVVEDSSEDDNDGLPKDYKVVVASVSSTRLDNVIKAGMSWKRKSVRSKLALNLNRDILENS